MEPGERMLIRCDGGPSISRLERYPPPLEIEERRGGVYVLVDDGPPDRWWSGRRRDIWARRWSPRRPHPCPELGVRQDGEEVDEEQLGVDGAGRCAQANVDRRAGPAVAAAVDPSHASVQRLHGVDELEEQVRIRA
jgi:hypothetical protein